jgi:hypothetical protein
VQFELVESLSLPGDPAKANDDALAFRPHAAVVMDGATGLGESLMPGPSDAAWLARFGANRLMAHSEDHDPKDALAAALHDAETSFSHLRRREPQEKWENPYASMIFVSLDETGFEALWFGDCAALIERPGASVELIGDSMKKKARERDRVAALAKMTGHNSAAPGVRDVFLPALRKARDMINSEKGGWLFGPDARAAEHVSSAHIEAARGTHVLLASDGFLALVSDYDRYELDALMKAARKRGLAEAGKELREIEALDPEGVRFPRFKTSDDATALLLKIV